MIRVVFYTGFPVPVWRAVLAIGALWLLQRRAFRTAAEAPAVVCAGLLASPFVLDYDLTLVAIPLVWLLGEGRRAGSCRLKRR